MVPRKKKETDYAALQSPFMQIPRMKVEIARDLLDLGVVQVYQLQGRSPEVLFENLRKLRPQSPADTLSYFRMAVHFAETGEAKSPHAFA